MVKHYEARVTMHGLCERIAAEIDGDAEAVLADLDGLDAWIANLSRSVAVSSADARGWLDAVLFSFADNYAGECPDAMGAADGPCATCGADDTRGRYDHRSLDLDHAEAVAIADLSGQAPTGWLGKLLPPTRVQRSLALTTSLQAA